MAAGGLKGKLSQAAKVLRMRMTREKRPQKWPLYRSGYSARLSSDLVADLDWLLK
ncbi:hypothetical protein [Desulfitispora alkaliphila]|uniref:hypothetical protein n=1 Tax=Desulfitispora alkaliphila TaxID=622674 RepID=UPI003D1FEA77